MSENHRNERPVPSLNEMEDLLLKTRPRPTARLRRMVTDAPWQNEERGLRMNAIRRLEFVGSGAVVILLIVIAAVFFLQGRPKDNSTNGIGENSTTGLPASGMDAAPLPTRPIKADPTATAIPELEAVAAWEVHLAGETGAERPSVTGITYETGVENGRLFVANGLQGIQVFSADGEQLNTISILDPETGQPVFVRDLVWSRLFWFAPPENGLIVLTDPFESGPYLHVVDPDQGTILSSLEINNNIALDTTAATVDVTVPTRLSVSEEGDLFTDRVYSFAEDSAEPGITALNYLLRMTIDGRILNPKLVTEQVTDGEPASVIAAIAYQNGTQTAYVAEQDGTGGVIQKYDLIGTPRLLGTVADADALLHWQDAVALTSDGEGHIYILVDGPGYIVEVDETDAVVNVFGFRDLAEAGGYPAVSQWLPGGLGRPLAMAVSADGKMLVVVDEEAGGARIRGFGLE